MRNGCNIDNVENLCTVMLIANHFLRTQKHKVLQDFFLQVVIKDIDFLKSLTQDSSWLSSLTLLIYRV